MALRRPCGCTRARAHALATFAAHCHRRSSFLPADRLSYGGRALRCESGSLLGTFWAHLGTNPGNLTEIRKLCHFPSSLPARRPDQDPFNSSILTGGSTRPTLERWSPIPKKQPTSRRSAKCGAYSSITNPLSEGNSSSGLPELELILLTGHIWIWAGNRVKLILH